MTSYTDITRERARALIAEHKITALEPHIETRPDGSTYELDHNQFFRLGDGRLLWRQDSSDEYGEEWMLADGVISASAHDALKRISG